MVNNDIDHQKLSYESSSTFDNGDEEAVKKLLCLDDVLPSSDEYHNLSPLSSVSFAPALVTDPVFDPPSLSPAATIAPSTSPPPIMPTVPPTIPTPAITLPKTASLTILTPAITLPNTAPITIPTPAITLPSSAPPAKSASGGDTSQSSNSQSPPTTSVTLVSPVLDITTTSSETSGSDIAYVYPKAPGTSIRTTFTTFPYSPPTVVPNATESVIPEMGEDVNGPPRVIINPTLPKITKRQFTKSYGPYQKPKEVNKPLKKKSTRKKKVSKT